MRQILVALLVFITGLSSPVKAKEVKVDNQLVHYTERGSGSTIIFVHGWTCNETSWSNQVLAFARKHHVVTLDLPGHGKSEIPPKGKYSMDLFADAVEAVRVAVHADRVVLVGHSMGAAVIRQYALRHPDHLAGLVAVDGPLDIRPLTAEPANFPPMTFERRQQMVEGMFVPETSKSVRNKIRKMMLGTGEVTAVGSSGLMFDPANRSDQIINAPALTIYAGRPLFPIYPATKEMLPKWESAQIPETGHFPMMEKPIEFNRLLADFLLHRATYQNQIAS